MKDAPPVTRTFLLRQIVASRRPRASRVFDDPDELLKLRYSNIFFCSLTGAFAHEIQAAGIAPERANCRGYSSRAVRVRDQSAIVLADNACRVALFWRDGENGAARSKDRIEFAGDNNAAQAAADGHNMNIASGHHTGNFARGPKGKEPNRGAVTACFFEARAIRAITDEHQLRAVSIKRSCRVDEGVPSAIEAEIARMQCDEIRRAPDFTDGGVIRRRLHGGKRSAIANDDYAIRGNAFREDALAHVVTKDDNARSTSQGVTMHALPQTHPTSRAHNFAADRHLRIQIADVVNERQALHSCNRCADDAGEGRICHGKNKIGMECEGTGNSKRNVTEIVGDATAHAMPGKSRGTYALDDETVSPVAAKERIWIALLRIIRRSAGKNRDTMTFREDIDDSRGDISCGGSIGREILIQQQNMHCDTPSDLARNDFHA